MEQKELEELRNRVECAAVLEQAGFAVDPRESTRRAVKYRRDDKIIIVIHEGNGWFDPLSEAKGDVFSLVGHLESLPFVEILARVASLVGFVPTEPAWTRPARAIEHTASISERWAKRRRPWLGSMTWRYLSHDRHLPESVLSASILHNLLREGPRGSMWAAQGKDAPGRCYRQQHAGRRLRRSTVGDCR